MDKTVFLINDRKWQDVLSLVPISIWTEPPSQQPLLIATPIIHAAWVEGDDADARGTTQFLSEDGSVCFGELRGTEYRALHPLHSPCPLVIRLSGPFDQPESRLIVETEGGTRSVLSLPQLSLHEGEEQTLYVAADGSTYADASLQTLVRAWPDRPVQKVPTLVYHQEANGIDVDSTLHFLRSYLGRSSEAKIIHIGPFPAGLKELLDSDLELREQQTEPVESVRALQAKEDDIDTWVIVARDDYRSGMVAAAFASLHHALLFFLDANNLADYENMTADGKKVYLIGDIDEQVKEHFRSQAETFACYTREEIQQFYLAQTLTDKIILVNPDDLKLEVEEYNPILLNVMQGKIDKVYGKMSLVAPFLAAAKHELILPISSTNPYTIDYLLDDFVKETDESLGIKMQYLTIMASPEAIPMAISIGEHKTRSGDVWVELDGRHYASLGRNEAEIDLAVGRIFGITVSDCSAYVARVLFFDDMHRQPDKLALLIMTEAKVYENGVVKTVSTANELRKYMTNEYWTPDVKAQFDDFWEYLGEEALDLAKETSDPNQIEKVKCFRERYQKATLILYIGHADCNGVRGIIDTTEPYYREMYLNFPVIIGAACLTGAYEWVKRDQKCSPKEYKLTNLFAAQNIRRGAMGQQCAVDYAYRHEECDELLRGLYVEGLTLGEAFRRAKNAELKRDEESPHFSNWTDHKVKGDPHYVLVGDPTFRPKRDSQ